MFTLLVWVLGLGCTPPGSGELRRGEQLIRAGRPAEAIGPLRLAIEAFGTNAPAAAQGWNYLGLAYHHAGRPDEAAQAYKAALDKDFNLVVARYNRGALFFDQGNLPAAINELTTYTTHRPQDPAGWVLLGRAQLRAGLHDPADRHLQQALRLNPPPALQAEALNALGLGQAQRRRAREAFQYFEAALNRDPRYAPALLNQAVLSQQLNDRPFALQKYAAYLAVASNAPNAAAIRKLTNQLALALAAVPARATNLALLQPTTRTSAPPTLVATSRPPATVRTAAPPALVRTSPPPAVTRTSAPPEVALQAPPPATNPPTARVEPPPATGVTQAPPAIVATPPPSTSTGTVTEVARADLRPPVPTPAPEPAPEPPLETVRIEEDAGFQPAVDVSPPPSRASEGVAVTPLDGVTNRVATPPPDTAEAPPAAERKRSLFSRLNPVGWFGGGDEEEKAREREEKEARKAAEQARKAQKEAEKEAARRRNITTPVDKRPVRTAQAPAAPSPAPVYARYAYASPAVPAAGDRAQAERLVADGVAAHRAGRLPDALAAYGRAVEADPSSHTAQHNLAVAAADSQDWSRSLAAYERALAIQPGDARTRYGFSLALARAGYPADAAAEAEKVLAREPANVDAHLALANLYAGPLADIPKAREHYLKVLQLQPNHPQAATIKRWLGPAYRP